MVSEGVDIPRLRVGVYATSARTELFFRQVVGRFIRRTPAPRDQMSHVFLPADPTLKRLAAQVEEERSHALTLEPKGEPLEEQPERRALRAGRRVPRALVERARRGRDAADDAAGGDDVAVRGRPAAVAGARRVHDDGGRARERRRRGRRTRPRTSAASGCATSAARSSRRVARLTGEPYSVIHARVNRDTGAASVTAASAAQLEKGNALLEREAARRGASALRTAGIEGWVRVGERCTRTVSGARVRR